MSLSGEPLPFSLLLAAASNLLAENGYRVARDIKFEGLPRDRALLAEDDYSVVAVSIYSTWQELEKQWPDAQAELVELLARKLSRSAPKIWDGYLVLLCSDLAPSNGAVSQIERDTSRVRKIVATSDMVRIVSDLESILDILMPLPLPSVSLTVGDVLDALPDVLKGRVDAEALRAVVDAFRGLEPPLEKLHMLGGLL
jgi:hypothetical protein